MASIDCVKAFDNHNEMLCNHQRSNSHNTKVCFLSGLDRSGTFTLRYVTITWNVLIFTLIVLLMGFTQSVDAVQADATIVAYGNHSECVLDKDGMNTQLRIVLEQGQLLLKRIMRRRQKDKHICPNLWNQLEGLDQKCPTLLDNVLDNRWRQIYDTFHCACTLRDPECIASVSCLKKEMRSLPMARCEELYKFNINQHHKNKCTFLQKRAACKFTLVDSRCGTRAGQLLLDFMKDSSKRQDCPITKPTQYEDVAYTSKCLPNLTDSLDKCEKRHLNEPMKFQKDYYLVAKGGTKKVMNACRDYDAYMECVGPIEERCPSGVRQYYEYKEELRFYLLRLKVICREQKQDYMSNLSCYKKTYSDVNSCKKGIQPIFEQIENTTAFDFYCNQDSPAVSQIYRGMWKFVKCYSDIAKALNCLLDPIEQLMNVTLFDPYNTMYGFRPDCDLHRMAINEHQKRATASPKPAVEPEIRWLIKEYKPVAEIKTYENNSASLVSRTLLPFMVLLLHIPLLIN